MKIFVASPVDVFYDADAEARLAQTNDSRFASARGILAVDEARWREAQRYERDTWLKHNLDASTDRNETHTDGFAAYAALPPDLGDYIELGCGPFTNSRYILQHRTAQSVTLLDPLVVDYAREHPHCAYRGGVLVGAHDGNQHPAALVGSTIEDYQPGQTFDTVVMTNVLSHCYDALAVFDAVQRLLKPGSYFVFHEDPRPFTPMDLYDAGHPLVVTQEVIDEFLSGFEEVYRNGNYFIGRKRGKPLHVEPLNMEHGNSLPPLPPPYPWDVTGEPVVAAGEAEMVSAPKKKGRRR